MFDINIKEFDYKALENKSILYYPIVSMRSYVDNTYDLSSDGNVNRFISFFNKVNFKKLTIILPSVSSNADFIKKYFKNKNVEYIFTPSYGINALDTRNNADKVLDSLNIDFSIVDTVIFEPNCLGKYNWSFLLDVYYWCPVSKTNNESPSFLSEELHKQDLFNVKNFQTIVCTDNQKKYFNRFTSNKITVHNLLLDEHLFLSNKKENKLSPKIIFCPFRLNDKGYKVEYIIDQLSKIKEDFIFLYTAPNDVIPEYINKINAIKVDKTRENYYNILSTSPIIIYLENPDEILHASIFEFISYNCNIIYMKNKLFSRKNKIGELTNILSLESTIKEVLNG